MDREYEVQFAKKNDYVDQHGNVSYSVKFLSESDNVLWTVQPTTTIEAGQKVFGHIETLMSKNGKQYRKFKRVNPEDAAQQGQGFAPKSAPKSSYNSPDRADGMRQGMAINNATALIIAFIRQGAYTNTEPQQISEDIKAFAKGIYSIDLTPSPAPVPAAIANTFVGAQTIEEPVFSPSELDEAIKGMGL